ncbi:MAG: histone deacetylase [Desulfobacterales bacterium]|nr:histone deacetylase [Desulfobacterales bacterium]
MITPNTKKRIGLVFFPAFDWAIDPTHPEREERLLYTQDQVFEEGLFDIDGIVEYKAGVVEDKDIQRVHFCVPNVANVMTQSHYISAGGAQTIAKAVMNKEIERGFALVRPPGHHAMRMVHGSRGFCNVNIEAIMIEYLREAYSIRKVAIVDTDCHHGDGTQDIYWHDPNTLFISIHQDGRTLYPGSGFPYELGGPNALGTTLNIPLPPRTSEEGYLYVINHVVMPILEEFKPDVIINSAGQDNHFTDPITNMNFSAQGYANMTSILKPDIAVLEGGYSIEGALPYVNVGIILALAGMDFSAVKEPDYVKERLAQPKEITRTIEKTAQTVMEYWKNRDTLKAQHQQSGKIYERQRHIYYDTSGISEFQQEKIRGCMDCAGALLIDSSSDGGYHVLAIHIPKHACQACSDQALQWYDKASKDSFDAIILQNRTTDQYLTKHKR